MTTAGSQEEFQTVPKGELADIFEDIIEKKEKIGDDQDDLKKLQLEAKTKMKKLGKERVKFPSKDEKAREGAGEVPVQERHDLHLQPEDDGRKPRHHQGVEEGQEGRLNHHIILIVFTSGASCEDREPRFYSEDLTTSGNSGKLYNMKNIDKVTGFSISHQMHRNIGKIASTASRSIGASVSNSFVVRAALTHLMRQPDPLKLVIEEKVKSVAKRRGL